MKNLKYLPFLCLCIMLLFSFKSSGENTYELRNDVIIDNNIEVELESCKELYELKSFNESCEEVVVLPKWLKKLGKFLKRDFYGAIKGLPLGPTGSVILGSIESVFGGSTLVGTNDNFPVRNNYNTIYLANEYDFVGIEHVRLLYESLSNENLVFRDGKLNYKTYLNYAKKTLVSNGNFSENEVNRYTVKGLSDDVKSLDRYESLSLPEFLQQMNETRVLSDQENEILQNYFQFLTNSDSFDQFLEYSKNIENTIIESNYEDSSKKVLLMTMSTVRHDIGFWLSNKDFITE